MTPLSSDPVFVLFAVLTSGLLLGRVHLWGLSLGTSGVVFTALAAGHLGLAVPEGTGTLGLVFFVYCVGLSAGPSFFRTFAQRGKTLAILSGAIVLLGAVGVAALARVLSLPADLAVGIFTGAMTSTPGLAAALEAASGSKLVAVGYGIAYPFGLLGVVLFVQGVPRLLGVALSRSDATLPHDQAERRLERIVVEVRNPALVGKRLDEIELPVPNVQIAQEVKDGRLIPVSAETRLEVGQALLMVGRAFRLRKVGPLFGVARPVPEGLVELDGFRRHIVVSSPHVVGKSLEELDLLGRFGITPVLLSRYDIEFVPGEHESLQFGDRITVVGRPDEMRRFADLAGHREKNVDVTDLASLGAGILAGLVLARANLSLGSLSVSPGTAGGPLLVGLMLGHLGALGPIRGSLPRAARLLLSELGLGFFLASAGTRAGGQLVATITMVGPRLGVAAVLAALIPLGIGYLLARGVFRLDLLASLGGTCGAMTSTPGLGALTAETDSEVPVVSYAAAYPVALVLMTVSARLLYAFLNGG